MTDLPSFLKDFSDVEPIHAALVDAKARAVDNQENAGFQGYTQAGVLHTLQSALNFVIDNQHPAGVIKDWLGDRVRTQLKTTAEEHALQVGHKAPIADARYLNRASELVLERFDTLLAMAQALEKPGTAISGETLEVPGHNPQITRNAL